MRYTILFVAALAIGPFADAFAKGWGGAGADSWQSGNGGQQAGKPGNSGGQGGQGGIGQGGAGGQGGIGQGGAASSSASVSTSQGQLQGQMQGQVQGVVTGQANEQGVTINEAAQDYHNMYEDYTAAAYAPPMPVSNCEDGKSIGLVIPTVGSVSLGGSSNNKNCERLEQVRIGIATGDQDTKVLANAVLQSMLEKSYAEIEEEDDSDTRAVTRPRSEPTASTGYDWDALGG